MLESISEESMPAGATVGAAESNHGDVHGVPASATQSNMVSEPMDAMRARLTMENDDFRGMSGTAQDVALATLFREQARLRAVVLAGLGTNSSEPGTVLRYLVLLDGFCTATRVLYS